MVSPAFPLFLIGCIPVRILLAVAVLHCTALPERVAAAVAATVAVGFAVIYTFALRRYGAETFGAPVWWDHLRPVHALAYAVVAVLLWRGGHRRAAAAVLCVDAGIGLAAAVGRRVVTDTIPT